MATWGERNNLDWNKLSTDCVISSSVNMFKNNVDTYLRMAVISR